MRVKNNMQFVDFKAEALEYKKNYQKVFDRVLDSGWYILGKEVESFEQEFANYLGSKYVIGVANGLEAIQISLMSMGVGVGDEVITTPLSAVATTLAIIAVGATPIFVDIKEDGEINEDLIEEAITTKTKVILPVHLYGNACKIDIIKNIAIKHNLFLLEDSAQGHGSTYNGEKLGTIGDVGCFSFYPTKNLGALGDGGAIATNNSKFAESCRQIRDYGQSKKYEHVVYGLNSRLDELQAAFLREKLTVLDIMNDRRRAIAQKYFKLLDTTRLSIVASSPDSTPNYHQFVIRVRRRDELQQYLKEKNIPTLIHYPITIPDQPMFSDRFQSLSLPVARQLVQETISIPCGPYLESTDVELIASTINTFLLNN